MGDLGLAIATSDPNKVLEASGLVGWVDWGDGRDVLPDTGVS